MKYIHVVTCNFSLVNAFQNNASILLTNLYEFSLLNTVAEEIILNQFNKTNQYVFSANYLQNNFLNDFTNRYFFI